MKTLVLFISFSLQLSIYAMEDGQPFSPEFIEQVNNALAKQQTLTKKGFSSFIEHIAKADRSFAALLKAQMGDLVGEKLSQADFSAEAQAILDGTSFPNSEKLRTEIVFHSMNAVESDD